MNSQVMNVRPGLTVQEELLIASVTGTSGSPCRTASPGESLAAGRSRRPNRGLEGSRTPS